MIVVDDILMRLFGGLALMRGGQRRLHPQARSLRCLDAG